MKRIFQYGFALALAACSFAACSDDDTGENGVKTDVTLSPSTSLTGVSFSANTLNVSNNGIYPSASIAVKKADGSALSGVTLQVELSNNSASEEWCQIEPKNNALQFTVLPYEGGEAARSIDVRLTGSEMCIRDRTSRRWLQSSRFRKAPRYPPPAAARRTSPSR